MLIRDVVNGCVAECTEDTPLTEVFDLIQKCEHGFVVVLDSPTHRVPLGIVNEHTICEQMIAKGRKPTELRAGGVMNTCVRRVSAATPVESGREILRIRDSAPILVVDEKRRFCGLVTREAIASALRQTSVPVFTPAASVPALREIPAFGWLR